VTVFTNESRKGRHWFTAQNPVPANIPLAGSSATFIVLRMKHGSIAALMTLLSLVTPAWADTGNLEKQLKSDYVGKTLTLRHFYHGSHLRFHPDGTLQGDALIGPWTMDGQIAVEGVHVDKGVLDFRGRRINVIFDASHRPVDQITMLSQYSGKQRKEMEKSLRQQQVRVEIELPNPSPTPEEIALPIHAVFLMAGESMMEIVPAFWRSYFAELEGKPVGVPQPSRDTVYRVSQPGTSKGGVSPPRPIRNPDPEYSDQARKAKYQGTILVWMIIDPSGETRDIRVVRPLGMGLDEKALAAISTWIFEPARKDGEPVAVMVNVEVSFRLY
jgi:TonB family protein